MNLNETAAVVLLWGNEFKYGQYLNNYSCFLIVNLTKVLFFMSMKRILVAIDFSGDSINALEHAIIVANAMQTHLRLVFVSKRGEFAQPFNFHEESYQDLKSVEDYFTYIFNKYGERYKVENGVFDFKVRKGKVYVEINSLSLEDDTFLIIMGTHGISGFEELMLGSNAFRVVTKAQCPVITIRNGFSSSHISRIVLPLDVSNQTRQKVPFVTEIATAFNTEVHVLGVRETDGKEVISRITQYVDQVYDFLVSKNIKVVKEEIKGSNITKITIEYAKSIDADLISIMTDQTESPENIWLGPYAQQMVNHSPIPVLSIHTTLNYK